MFNKQIVWLATFVAGIIMLAAIPTTTVVTDITKTTGNISKAAVVKDNSGTVLGRYTGHQSSSPNIALLLEVNDSYPPVPMEIRGDNFAGTNTILYFTTTNCTGTAYLSHQNPQDNNLKVRSFVNNSTKEVWVADGSASSQSTQSRLNDQTGSCTTASASINVKVATNIADLDNYTAPYSVE
jgi:hypothetical protein